MEIFGFEDLGDEVYNNTKQYEILCSKLTQEEIDEIIKRPYTETKYWKKVVIEET